MKLRNSIECWVINENDDVLLLRRPETSTDPFYWQPITGAIESGESAEEACIRELKEEVSINLRVDEIIKLESDIKVYLEAHDLLVMKTLFMTRRISNQTKVLISDEHDEFKWIPVEGVNDLLL